jgi:CRP-like cAMP-binding protein
VLLLPTTVPWVVAGTPALHGFISGLSERDQTALLSLGRRRRFHRNARMFTEGDPSDFVLVVLEGNAKIVVTTELGDESLLGVRGPGDLLGELGALDSAPRLASAVALEPLEGQVVTADEFRAFVAQHPDTALELTRMIIGRLREADRRRAEFGSYDATSRVARLLADLAAEQSRAERPGADVRLSQEEIGELVGTSRESVARALAVLRERGLVSTGHRSVTVLEFDALRSFRS